MEGQTGEIFAAASHSCGIKRAVILQPGTTSTLCFHSASSPPFALPGLLTAPMNALQHPLIPFYSALTEKRCGKSFVHEEFSSVSPTYLT
ncbi:hypothetical protein E2C01_043003 [Portunus trituberculatus]|uniref:Uncharacterized protein n=1 Tax=Portunus trituberculatus TaxID=210409 RepID=A0A5B7FUX6_PORTR|nr:hypothetical protein [Portunus trituberculatus]